MRDFFERQDDARRLSGRLAAVLAGAAFGTILATALVLAGVATVLALLQVVATTNFKIDPDYWLDVFANRFYVAAALAGALVIGVAVHRTWLALDSGGASLARQLGGTRVLPIDPPPQHRQLVNVVEELAIATGAPAPKIYVMEQEPCINAFAAGIEPNDAVVGVTQGALERLDRSQLQGVLAHEFSHIVNQDVRINIQTLGALQGIETIAAASRRLLGMGVKSGINGSMLATFLGCVLWPVGQIGVLFASLARMALNRQREYLADAAAVQYTRHPEGLSSALKLIASDERQGRLESEAAQSASHLFFTEGASPLGLLLRSHPPIEVRIGRLDPDWDGMLPLSLPADVASLVGDADADRKCEPSLPVARSAPSERPGPTDKAAPSASASARFSSNRLSAATGELATGDGGVSAADQQAFLDALSAVRTNRGRREYSPTITHWPTLAATAATVIGGSIIFTWLTSP